LLDEVFGEHNFENQIIWQKIKSVKAQTIGYGNVTDYILFYRKSPQLEFNQTRIPHKEEYLRTMYRHVEKDGRRYRLHDFTQSGSGPARRFGRRGYIDPPAGKHWICLKRTLTKGWLKG